MMIFVVWENEKFNAMSLFDDYRDNAVFEQEFPFGLPSDVWQSKSGPIRLADMSNEHIKNCMRIVGEDDKWYWRFQQELDRRNTKTR